MKLVIDYRLAAYSYRGMARYCREMTTELFKILSKDWDIILYVDKNYKIQHLPVNCKIRVLPTKNYILGEQVWMAYYLRKDKADFLWSPANTFPLSIVSKIKIVVTVHDLIFFSKSEGKQSIRQWIGRIYRHFIVKYGIKRITACCTVSNFTKKELEQKFNKENIVLTYNCIGNFAKLVESLKSYRTYKRGSRFFTLSGDAPSKNLKMLFDWFSLHPDFALDVAGLSENSMFRKSCPQNINILPPNLSEEKIIEYYCTCRCFLFVSKQEGFGFPLLEAMVCGCKLIISNTTSIPEIVGENALYIDPDKFDDLTMAINSIENFSLNPKNVQIQLAQYYNWKNSANNLAVLLNEML